MFVYLLIILPASCQWRRQFVIACWWRFLSMTSSMSRLSAVSSVSMCRHWRRIFCILLMSPATLQMTTSRWRNCKFYQCRSFSRLICVECQCTTNSSISNCKSIAISFYEVRCVHYLRNVVIFTFVACSKFYKIELIKIFFNRLRLARIIVKYILSRFMDHCVDFIQGAVSDLRTQPLQKSSRQCLLRTVYLTRFIFVARMYGLHV